MGNDDPGLGWPWLNSGEIQPAYRVLKLLKYFCGRPIFTLPGGQAELGFMRRAEVGDFVELFRRGIGIAPEKESVCSGAQARVKACAQELRDLVGIVLGRRSPDFLHHDRTASAA